MDWPGKGKGISNPDHGDGNSTPVHECGSVAGSIPVLPADFKAAGQPDRTCAVDPATVNPPRSWFVGRLVVVLNRQSTPGSRSFYSLLFPAAFTLAHLALAAA